VAHFLIRAMAGEPINIFGDGRQVRDILFVADAVDAYLAAWRKIDVVQGSPFNLGGGPDNAVSLLQLLDHIRDLTGRRVETLFFPARAGDQRYYVSDARRALSQLGLRRPCAWREGVRKLWAWLEQEAGGPALVRATELQS
jgi:CDP-paratose 2-epimerase